MAKDKLGGGGNTLWATPPEIFQPMDDFFHFTLDAAALSSNKKVDNYLGPDHFNKALRDSLSVDWGENRVFLNPPLDDTKPWLEKCRRQCTPDIETGTGTPLAVCIVNVATANRWWASAMEYATEVWFLTPRVRFIDPELTGKDQRAANRYDSAFFVYTPLFVPKALPRFVYWHWEIQDCRDAWFEAVGASPQMADYSGEKWRPKSDPGNSSPGASGASLGRSGSAGDLRMGRQCRTPGGPGSGYSLG